MDATTAVSEAAQQGDTARIEALLADDPNLVNSYGPGGWTPLHLAVFFGHRAAAEALLRHEADVQARSQNDLANQPLHAAAAESSGDQRAAILALLLDHGADVNATQHGGWTALHAAAENGDGESVRVLLAHGADINARNDAGQTPLGYATRTAENPTAALLREHGGVA